MGDPTTTRCKGSNLLSEKYSPLVWI